MKSYSSRKFIIVLGSMCALTVAFFLTSKLDAGNFVIGLCTLAGLYLGANTVSSKLTKGD